MPSYYIRKLVTAKSVQEAIRLEKKGQAEITDVWVNKDEPIPEKTVPGFTQK